MLQPNFFNTVFVIPILNLLVLFYKAFLFIRLPGAFGFSIIALTAFVRILFQPFFHKQMETAKKMQELKPHLDRIQAKHKKDPKKLQEEQMRLYKEAGVNPAAGCLFMIIQIPVFIALYQTLQSFLMNGQGEKIISQINKVVYGDFLKIQTIDPWFFGFNLALTPAQAHSWQYYLIPLITGILQYLQFKVSMPATPPAAPADSKELAKEGEVKKDGPGDFQKAMNTQMKYMFPIMIGWFSYTLPVGLSLYWNVFSVFSIMQYKKLHSKKDTKS